MYPNTHVKMETFGFSKETTETILEVKLIERYISEESRKIEPSIYLEKCSCKMWITLFIDIILQIILIHDSAYMRNACAEKLVIWTMYKGYNTICSITVLQPIG